MSRAQGKELMQAHKLLKNYISTLLSWKFLLHMQTNMRN
jgi:hypothetical protein